MSASKFISSDPEVVTVDVHQAKDLLRSGHRSEPEVVTVDVHQAKDLLRSGHRYLDVRTEAEFKQGHLENSLNIPYMFDTPTGRVKNPKFLEQVLASYKTEDLIIVGCRTGVRSLYATSDLMNEDFKHVINMGGGYIDWVEKGFAVKKPIEQEL